jgi:radical SAM-linked protein
MMKIRLAYTKKGEARYIAHLDLTRMLDRALRRAQIEVAFSEGFNPHPKIAFGPPLPVGVEGEQEYVDIEVKENTEHEKEAIRKKAGETTEAGACDIKDIVERLQSQLPEGIKIIGSGIAEKGSKALMAVINLARYRTEVPLLRPVEAEELRRACRDWLNRDEVTSIRYQQGKKIERNIRSFVKNIALISEEGVISADAQNHQIQLRLDIITGNAGSVRPVEILESLKNMDGLPVDIPGITTTREGLFIEQSDGVLRNPLEVIMTI